METGLFILMFVNLMLSFVFFEVLLSIQHDNFHDKWLEEGKTTGYLMTLSGGSWFGGSINRMVRFMVWSLLTDQWMRSDSKALLYSRLMRTTCLIHWILMYLFFYLIYSE